MTLKTTPSMIICNIRLFCACAQLRPTPGTLHMFSPRRELSFIVPAPGLTCISPLTSPVPESPLLAQALTTVQRAVDLSGAIGPYKYFITLHSFIQAISIAPIQKSTTTHSCFRYNADTVSE